MRLGRLLLLVALVLVVGLAAVYFLSQNGSSTQLTQEQIAATEAAKQTVPVVYLAQPVVRGEVITGEKLAVSNLPKNDVPDVMFNTVSEVIGKMARFDLEQGVFLTSGMVMDDLTMGSSDVGSEHATLIPEGMVAFPVPINRFSSVAYGISKGDRVNVIVTLAMVDLDTQFQSILPNQTAGVLTPGGNVLLGSGVVLMGEQYANIVSQSVAAGPNSVQGRAELDALLDQPFYYVPSEAQRSRVVSQMILQNVVVLHVGTFPVYNESGQQVVLATPEPANQQQNNNQPTPTPQPKQAPPDIVTLIMWPQEAVTLNYLIYTGAELTLALRSPSDTTQTLTDAVTLQYLMDVYRIPLPVRLPYGTQPRVDDLVPPVLENDATEQ